MTTRVKLHADYRKSISTTSDLIELSDYSPKHLLSSKEIKNAHLEKQIKTLNEYEEKRNAFQKYYYKKKITYYICVSFISLGLLALLIFLGIKLF